MSPSIGLGNSLYLERVLDSAGTCPSPSYRSHCRPDTQQSASGETSQVLPITQHVSEIGLIVRVCCGKPEPFQISKIVAQNLYKAIILHTFGVQEKGMGSCAQTPNLNPLENSLPKTVREAKDTRNPKDLNPKPKPLNPKPETLNPKL